MDIWSNKIVPNRQQEIASAKRLTQSKFFVHRSITKGQQLSSSPNNCFLQQAETKNSKLIFGDKIS